MGAGCLEKAVDTEASGGRRGAGGQNRVDMGVKRGGLLWYVR